MGYTNRSVRDGHIKIYVRDAIYTSMDESLDIYVYIYSDGCEMGYIHRWVRGMTDIEQ